MLKGLTSTFKDGCNNVELTYKEYVKLGNDIIPVKATLKDDSYENGNFIGTFILKEIQFETEATYEFRNKEFEYYKEVDGESIKIGTFISTDITINDTTEIVKVVGMDYGLKTQVEYTSALDYASGEITLKDVWDECCQLSGLESGIDDFANSDFIVDSDQFSGTGAMIRDVFKGIAMSSGSFVKVMNDDKVYLIFNEITSEKEELEIDGSASVDDVLKIDELTQIEGNTTQSGTPTPSSPQPINVVSGRQEVSVVGKNLFDKNNIVYAYINSNGNAVNDNSHTNALSDYILVDQNTNYAFSANTRMNGLNVAFFNSQKQFTSRKMGQPANYNSFNTESNSYIRVWCNFDASTEMTPSVIESKEVQLEKGNQPSQYEAFKGQSYEINLGKNLINYSATGTGQDIDYNFNGSELSLNGTTSGSGQIATTSSQPITLPMGTYTFSSTTSGTFTANGKSVAIYLRKISDNTGVVELNQINRYTLTKTFTLSETTKLYIQIYTNGSDFIFDNLKIQWQVEKGSQATSYSPYKTPIELCEINDYEDMIFRSKGVNLFDKSTITINYYIDASGEIVSSTGTCYSDYIEVEPNTTYTITGRTSYRSQAYYDSNKNFIKRDNNQTNFTTDANTHYIRVNSMAVDINLIMLNKGSNSQPYEPYNSKGKWLLHKEIGKVVLDGSETFTNPSNTSYSADILRFGTTISNKKYAINNTSKDLLYCNNFPISFLDYQARTIEAITGHAAEHSVYFFINKNRLSSANTTGFKTWLSTHNTTVYYVLATPTTTEITDTELINQLNSIELLEGLNNISITSNDLTGKLKLTYYNNEFDIIEDYVELEDKRDTHPWTCLRLGMSNIDGENVDYIDEDLVAQYGENWLILNDNPFAYNQEKRQQLIMNIFNQIKAFGYSAFVSKVAFKPYLTSGDLIRFKNRDGDLVRSIVLRYTHNAEQITLEAPSETSATVNYIYPLGAIDIAKQTQIEVDKDKVQITNLTQQTQTIQSDLRDNYYTLEQTNQLIQTASTGLTNTFSEAGGNNIFRNTGLWFATSDSSNPYEFWNGVVVRQKEEKASNMSAMLLQNGNVSQEQLVPNGKYTISFKYNKPIALATAKIYINDTEYVLSATEDTEFIQVIEVSSQHINIIFNCDVNNGCEIYDLMVNAGEVKLAYSQNQNETTTDTVNISKGIEIVSSDLDVTFRADADGIRTLDKSDNEITKFTDVGMRTKEAIIESKSQIVGTLWQEVGNQTWITRL